MFDPSCVVLCDGATYRVGVLPLRKRWGSVGLGLVPHLVQVDGAERVEHDVIDVVGERREVRNLGEQWFELCPNICEPLRFCRASWWYYRPGLGNRVPCPALFVLRDLCAYRTRPNDLIDWGRVVWVPHGWVFFEPYVDRVGCGKERRTQVFF